MNKVFAIVCLLTGLWAGVVGAQSRPAVYGVWRGTLGTQEVMVNLKPEGCDSSYYYLRHRWGIWLEVQGASTDRWREGVDGAEQPTWDITTVTDASLVGSWTDAKGQHKLPLRLKRVAPAPKPGGCDTPAGQHADGVFNAPRLAAKVPESKAATFKGRPFQRLSLPGTGILTVQIPDAPHPVPRLNQRLRSWLRSELAAYYDCQLSSTRPDNAANPAPDYETQHEPVFWNAHLVVLRETYSYYCGGAYPNAGVSNYLVWDLDADQPLATERWFRNAKGPVERWTPSPQLRRLLARHMAKPGADENDCRDVIAQAYSYMIYPKPAGMVFTPVLPHAAQACADDLLVPWRDLRALLTPAGWEAVTSKVQAAAH